MANDITKFSGAGVLSVIFGLAVQCSLGQTQLHDPANLTTLKSLGEKASLTAEGLAQARDAMLKINNEARLNKDYRRQKGLRQDVDLPAGLEPLALSDKLNAAAQEQAEDAAGVRAAPRGKQVPGLMASGTGSLADFPVGWQASDSTYRPTWNLGGSPVDSVGFGAAKNARTGQWSVVAVWADLGGSAFKDLGLHDLANVKKLASFSDKNTLTPEELQAVREAMLQMNNEARANPEYRRKMGSKTALEVAKGLDKLVLDDVANKAAQVQADYQAGITTVTHDNRNYRDFGDRMNKANIGGALEACGGSANLVDYPTSWMKGDTHYRPTWNIDIPVRRVGYGVAKSPRDGTWYCTALWRPVEAGEPPSSPAAGPVAGTPASGGGPKATPAAGQPAAGQPAAGQTHLPAALKTIDGKKPKGVTVVGTPVMMSGLTKGGILYRGDRMASVPAGDYSLIITKDGAVAIADAAGTVKWSAGKGGTHVEFQAPDGNFCLYDDQKQWKWGTQPSGPNLVNGHVRLTQTGVLEQLDADGNRVWASQ